MASNGMPSFEARQTATTEFWRQLYGHPFGVTTGEAIVAHLNENRRPNPKHSASLLDLRARLDPSILKEDKNPG